MSLFLAHQPFSMVAWDPGVHLHSIASLTAGGLSRGVTVSVCVRAWPCEGVRGGDFPGQSAVPILLGISKLLSGGCPPRALMAGCSLNSCQRCVLSNRDSILSAENNILLLI